MKKIIIVLGILVCVFSCKEDDNAIEQNEDTNASKFEDINGCNIYKNLYDALPHFDTYKQTEFGELNCMSVEGINPYSIMLNAHYYGKDFSELNVYLFEVTGESANVELNVINLANAAYTTLSTFPDSNIFKSSLSQFENPSIYIAEPIPTDNRTFATYTANYNAKYSIKIQIKLPGNASLEAIELFIKDYLDAINKASLV